MVMEKLFELETELPPTLNHTYMYVNGRVAMVKDAKNYKKDTAMIVRSMDIHVDGSEKFYVVIKVHISTNRRDVDSNEKLVLDSVFNGLGVNDIRVFELHLHKIVDGKNYIHIEVGVLRDEMA